MPAAASDSWAHFAIEYRSRQELRFQQDGLALRCVDELLAKAACDIKKRIKS